MPEMEGMLFKWTNYVTGWQPRWFILDKGILAYYKSQDEVGQGCKGSVKLACCEIQVHPTDPVRMDLIIPGEQYFYVKSTSEAERQHWLVALGSAKACLTDSVLHQEKEESVDDLKRKMSEVRLYCDLLMQQVTSVQKASKDLTDSEKLKESSSLISQTCDTFLNTLKECINIANNSFLPHISQGVTHDAALHSSGLGNMKRSTPRSRSVEDRYTPPTTNKYGIQTRYHNLEDLAARRRNSKSRVRSSSTSSNENVATETNRKVKESKGSDTESRTSIEEKEEAPSDLATPRIPTFFTEMETKFSDIEVKKDGSVPVLTFLSACVSIVGIFDALSATAFAPVKMDINGNIRKIRQKYKSDPDNFETLQDIMNQEVETKTTKVKNSATDAIMWLRRSLQFIQLLLKEIVRGETDISTAASNAYGDSLKKYHGWVVRGIFVLALKAAPSLEEFQGFIAINKEDIAKEEFIPTLMKDVEECQIAMERVTNSLLQFFTQNDLESSEVV